MTKVFRRVASFKFIVIADRRHSTHCSPPLAEKCIQTSSFLSFFLFERKEIPNISVVIVPFFNSSLGAPPPVAEYLQCNCAFSSDLNIVRLLIAFTSSLAWVKCETSQILRAVGQVAFLMDFSILHHVTIQ